MTPPGTTSVGQAGSLRPIGNRPATLALYLALTALPLCAQTGAAGDDWPTYGGTYAAWRYSVLA